MPRTPSAKTRKPPVKRRPPPRAAETARHEQGLRISTEITSWWHEARGTAAMQIKPKDVIDVLKAAKVDCVLMGAHAMAGWFDQPRATIDVDVLIYKRHHRRAVEAIREAFPTLTVKDTAVVTRFIDPVIDKAVIDLMKPMHQLHQAVFKNSIEIAGAYRIPDLEMALATKFAAMVAQHRDVVRRQQDAVDFSVIVKANKDRLNRDRLREFGELLYPNGGDEVVRYADEVVAGRPIQI